MPDGAATRFPRQAVISREGLLEGRRCRVYNSFKSLSRRQSFHPSDETTVRVDSSTARLSMRRGASDVPFLIFVRFGAHSMNMFSGDIASSRSSGSRLLPAH